MLDAQRYRAGNLRDEVHFTRRILIGHLLVGVSVAGLMVAHGVYQWGISTVLWYLLTILPMKGMMAADNRCRHLLGGMFLLYGITGGYYLTWVVPTLRDLDQALLPASLLPLWMGTMNLMYAVAGVCLMINRKVRRAVTVGFSLW
ncbi:hypothetical protein EI77_01663 [Prosthecobacter fusiformis]|uniref:Uncharacterized protein n=1 Tax=Prosthecobacter fusiformis TaxID=48464 RepID=A0A4R7S6W4_9BACT|nr:hypothetical protein [Prosthecobacter fusiformis]TDU73195.1 hypothetical protein EI77_01663 [Prosthecobacter fusiformis]